MTAPRKSSPSLSLRPSGTTNDGGENNNGNINTRSFASLFAFLLLACVCANFYYQLHIVDWNALQWQQQQSVLHSVFSNNDKTTSRLQQQRKQISPAAYNAGNGDEITMTTTTETAKNEAGRKESSVAAKTRQQNQQQQQGMNQGHRVAGLSCKQHGGPDDEEAIRDVVYWEDIPSDSMHVPPLKAGVATARDDGEDEEHFLTFEADEGGWNNVRMAMEIAVVMALVTGRTLVIPPEQDLYLLMNKGNEGKHKAKFSMLDFFHFHSIETEFTNFRAISLKEFLEKQALTGKLLSVRDEKTPVFPPGNRTDWTNLGKNWESTKRGDGKILWRWMREEAAHDLAWDNSRCLAAFPAKRLDGLSIQQLQSTLYEILHDDEIRYPAVPPMQRWFRRTERTRGKPMPVFANVTERMAEMLANRRELCIYDLKLQKAKVVHLKGEQDTGHRLLIHFYAFLFFQDWRTDLWVKRFVRDHLRYVDEIQCAAARVIKSVRRIARENGDPNGSFDSFHVRRGDFQYRNMHMSAEDIYRNNTKGIIRDNRTVFIATDEKNFDYFVPLQKRYHTIFLKDFQEELGDLNVNFYGMVDQLIAARGDVFFGAFYSTFTGYINRLRGYHSQKEKADGHDQGIIGSYYYVPNHMAHKRHIMRTYISIRPEFWAQEFPIGWRDIDHDVEATPARAVGRR